MVAVGNALVGTLSICDSNGGNGGYEFTQIELQVARHVRECALGVFELLDPDVSHLYTCVMVSRPEFTVLLCSAPTMRFL